MSKTKASFLVGIDSQTLVWAVRRQGTAEQLQRAKWLFDDLDEQGAQVIIPTVVIAEYLVPAPKKDHAAIIDAINRRFLIKPFDVECASLAAELFQIGKPKRQQNVPMGRECLRADTLIIATAKVHRAKLFYANDKNCRELAKQVLDARDLPLNAHDLFAQGGAPTTGKRPKPR